MSEKVYVPAEWASRAWIDNDEVPGDVQALGRGPATGSGARSASASTGSSPTPRSRTPPTRPTTSRSNGTRTARSTSRANCIDRHLEDARRPGRHHLGRRRPDLDEKITYRQLHERVCKFANVLKANGVKKGDRVTIYLPMIPEAAYAMLACARIGAVHSVVFGGFSPDSLAGRIVDADSKFIITADEGVRGGRPIPLKKNTDEALKKCKGDEKVLVVRRTGTPVPWTPGRDIWLHEELVKVDADCPPVEMSAEDPLFILYTSGSTGKPKGVLHTSGGYLVYRLDHAPVRVRLSRRRHLLVHGRRRLGHGPQLHPLRAARQRRHDADVRGRAELSDRLALLARHRQVGRQHLLHGADGHPRADGRRRRLRQAHRPLLAAAAGLGRRADQSGSVGVVLPRGRRRPLPDRRHLVADGDRRHPDHAAARRHQARSPARRRGRSSASSRRSSTRRAASWRARRSGNLVILDSWPGQMRTVYGDHERFVQTYFSTYKGMYFTGDGCRRDEDGYYWITGRVDDVINVSGHRLGTAEVESALVSHPKVAEAAVVGYPHDIKGQGIYCYVTLIQGESAERGAAARSWSRTCARRSARSPRPT